MLWLRLIFMAGLFTLGSTAVAGAADSDATRQGAATELEQPYRFGVFPYLTPLRMEAIYAPVSAALSRSLGHAVQFRTSSRFELFFEKLQVQSYDIALIQPFWYVPAVDQFGYLPLARMEEPFTSLIMVLEESSLRSAEDLRGQVVATPPAFVPVTHMAIRALEAEGMVPGRDLELRAFKSVDSCFQQILIGSAIACVSPPFAPPVIEEKLGVKLRVLMRSTSIPNLTFVIHPRVPEQDRMRFAEAILSWATSDSGRPLLRGMKTSRFVPAEDAEYDVVRELVKEVQRN